VEQCSGLIANVTCGKDGYAEFYDAYDNCSCPTSVCAIKPTDSGIHTPPCINYYIAKIAITLKPLAHAINKYDKGEQYRNTLYPSPLEPIIYERVKLNPYCLAICSASKYNKGGGHAASIDVTCMWQPYNTTTAEHHELYIGCRCTISCDKASMVRAVIIYIVNNRQYKCAELSWIYNFNNMTPDHAKKTLIVKNINITGNLACYSEYHRLTFSTYEEYEIVLEFIKQKMQLAGDGADASDAADEISRY
jgi:hypothetical protein